jgi:hypothetical protein
VARIDKKYDIAIICTHIMAEHLAQHIIRLRRMASIVVLWTWDNHHHYYENLSYNSLADIVLPGHGFCASAIRSPHYLLGQQVPLCTAQWPTALVAEILQEQSAVERSSSLYGGFVMWPDTSRNDQLLELQREIPNNRLALINVEDRSKYFGASPEDQIRDWAGHKVSLNLPYAEDLSLRVFDSLLTGVIPIVSRDCRDLDSVIPVELQKSLPVLRLDEISVAAVTEVYREGVARFDQAGQEGVLRRHVYARDHHHVSARVKQIVSYITDLNMSHDMEISIDDTGIGLIARPRE